jgi:hypothetical protein
VVGKRKSITKLEGRTMNLKIFAMAAILLSLSTGTLAQASEHQHPKHNMLLFGNEKVFASHIVYKEPHNFQVILALELPEEAKRHYLSLRDGDPTAQVVLLLDPSDIGAIESTPTISGVIVKRGSSSDELPLHVTLARDEFGIVFFNPLPLDLRRDTH